MSFVLQFMQTVNDAACAGHQKIIVDMRECKDIDLTACVLFASEFDRCASRYGSSVQVLLPRAAGPRDTLFAFLLNPSSRSDVGTDVQVMRVASGVRGDPSPGEKTFEVARLAEVFASGTLADRLHASLNEAAENVLAWAYGPDSSDPAERWWVGGYLSAPEGAVFVALDRGFGIPFTAPQNFGDSLRGALRTLKEGAWTSIGTPADWQVLLATIRQRRTQSGLEERGKGLTNMIETIDLFGSGRIAIISGDAIYGYQREPSSAEPVERCHALGYRFPGTMIVWMIRVLEKSEPARSER